MHDPTDDYTAGLAAWNAEAYPLAAEQLQRAFAATPETDHAIKAERGLALARLRNEQGLHNEAGLLAQAALRHAEQAGSASDEWVSIITLLDALNGSARVHRLLYDKDFQPPFVLPVSKQEYTDQLTLRLIKLSSNLANELSEPLGYAHQSRGHWCNRFGDYAQAEYHYRQALVNYEAPAVEHSNYAEDVWLNLGILYAHESDLKGDAQECFENYLAAALPRLGAEHPQVLDCFGRLATYLHQRGELNRAEPYFAQLRSVFDASSGATPLRWHRDAYFAFLHATGRSIEAAACEQRWKIVLSPSTVGDLLVGDHATELARREQLVGPHHPHVAACLLASGRAIFREEPHVARDYLVRALAIIEATFGPDHPHIATTLDSLIRTLRFTKQSAETAPYLERLKQLYRQQHGEHSWHYSSVLDLQAWVDEDCKRYESAEYHHLQAVSIAAAIAKDDSYEYAETLWRLALFYEKRARFTDILALGPQLLPLAEVIVRGDCSAYDYFAVYARALHSLGRLSEWQAFVEQVCSLPGDGSVHTPTDALWRPKLTH